MKKIFLLLSVTLLCVITLNAQSNYKIVSAKNMIKGTSTMHDWQCIVEKQSGAATINTKGTLAINSMKIDMDVKSIRSVEKNGSYYNESMDKNAYKALKADAYPNITYTLVSTSNVKTSGNNSTLTATGDLTIAGKTNRVSFPIKAVVSGNKVTFTGATKFKMSAFGIKPPTALMGTIKTGDEITIVINTTFTK